MFGRIVVGTDGSETAREAVRQAASLASSVNASLDVVSAFQPVSESRLRQERLEVPTDMAHTVTASEDVQATLAEAAKEVESQGVGVKTHARQGDPADAILDVAEEENADLIV